MQHSYREYLGRALVELGAENDRLVVVTPDVANSTRAIVFKEAYPERFFSVGIAEANGVGISAGLSTFGYIPLYIAYAMFACEKPFEQIRNMVCYPRMNVKIIATHAGISVGEDGVTHQALEDIALMRSIPGMTVLTPGDPADVGMALRTAVGIKGPVYVRVPRIEGRLLEHNDTHYEAGKGEVLRKGDDITLIATGIMVERALSAAEQLEAQNVHACVINIRSIKPIDRALIIQAAQDSGAILTLEDHNYCGGLYGTVAEVLVKECPVPADAVAVQDCFAESGNYQDLLEKYRLCPEDIVEKAMEMMARKRKGTDAILQPVRAQGGEG